MMPTEKVTVHKWDGTALEIEVKPYLTFSERNQILNMIEGDPRQSITMKFGSLMEKLLKMVVKLPEGIGLDDIHTDDLDDIFKRFREQLGFGADKEQSSDTGSP
ncbi:MAG: hypothetical protein PHZ19_09460 [Candidatus Thermoplasmatota archaeon]|nr:hypothetical protein [Candidatus Thermoplasmatota archaeon]